MNLPAPGAAAPPVSPSPRAPVAAGGLVVLGIATTQVGAAVAKQLFAQLGPGGTVFLRVALAALALGLLWRPRLRGYRRPDYALAVLFGLALAGMNFAIYSAIARIPLGIAVTLEFVGPLGVAIAGSRRPLDAAWALLAGAGILLLAPGIGAGLDGAGCALALLSGGCWAAYILLSTRVGRHFPGGAGLALAMAVAALVLLPVGLRAGGAALLRPRPLALGGGAALLSSVIPYSLELEALRRLPARVFGVLMSLEPAVAALVGAVGLKEGLGPRALAAVALVMVATLGATYSAAPAGR